MTAEDSLTAFLYILMRDKVPCGVVARILEEHLAARADVSEYTYSNCHLEAYAKEVAAFILNVSPKGNK